MSKVIVEMQGNPLVTLQGLQVAGVCVFFFVTGFDH
jgi:hypothetical protein